MPSIDDMLSLYTRVMRSMHACIEKTLPIHAPSAYPVDKTYACVCRTVHFVLRNKSPSFASVRGSGFMEFVL
jgi:hypothetical protein